MDDPPWPEVLIDLDQGVLRVGLQEKPSLAEYLRPTFHDRDHDLIDHERLRVYAQAFDHLHEERRVLGMADVSRVEREARNQEAPRPKRTRNTLPHQKSPREIPVAKDEPEHLRQIRELLEPDM